MRNWSNFLGVALLSAALAGAAAADTLELKDGRVLQGKYLGGTQAILRFELNGEVQTFSTNDIVALTFTRGSGQPQAEAAPRSTSSCGAESCCTGANAAEFGGGEHGCGRGESGDAAGGAIAAGTDDRRR